MYKIIYKMYLYHKNIHFKSANFQFDFIKKKLGRSSKKKVKEFHPTEPLPNSLFNLLPS